MKIGDLVRSVHLHGEIGIIVKTRTMSEPISGFVAKQTLYSVVFLSGTLLHGFRLWELEAVNESG